MAVMHSPIPMTWESLAMTENQERPEPCVIGDARAKTAEAERHVDAARHRLARRHAANHNRRPSKRLLRD